MSRDLEKKFGKPLARDAVSLPSIQKIVREEIARKFISSELIVNEDISVYDALFLEKMIKEEIITPELAYRIIKENVTPDIKQDLVAIGAKLRRQLQQNGIADNHARNAAINWIKKVSDLAGTLQGEAEQLSMGDKPKYRIADPGKQGAKPPAAKLK